MSCVNAWFVFGILLILIKRFVFLDAPIDDSTIMKECQYIDSSGINACFSLSPPSLLSPSLF